MANIFTIENFQDFSEKLNIDELYEKKRQYDLTQLNLFNKILNRIHVRIKTISKQRMNEQFCWYVVPEIIIGVPKYDQAACIAYVIDKLQQNGFNVRYVHPNTLFISWNHWVPAYVRTELKKKTGIVVNEYGVKIDEEKEDNNRQLINPSNPNDFMFNSKQQGQDQKQKPKREYLSVKTYKPTGNLIYDDDLLNKLEDKFT
jgi:hypothetical protein